MAAPGAAGEIGEQGEIGQGMAWLARSLRLAAEDRDDARPGRLDTSAYAGRRSGCGIRGRTRTVCNLRSTNLGRLLSSGDYRRRTIMMVPRRSSLNLHLVENAPRASAGGFRPVRVGHAAPTAAEQEISHDGLE